MENLNAEQIKKALECCISGDDCTMCPLLDEQSCPCVLNENALALITSQEQRIKELAEENARLIDAGFDTVDFAIEKKRDAKSDTVRKMQERLTSCFCPDCDYSGHDVRRVIDQIAKEMVEEK